MKLTFEPDLPHQLDAIKSITDLFANPLINKSSQYYDFQEPGFLYSILAVGNRLLVSPDQLIKSLHVVQNRNELTISDTLDDMHFSVEMETGTGKTYVYLRTIYELNHLYSLKNLLLLSLPSPFVKVC